MIDIYQYLFSNDIAVEFNKYYNREAMKICDMCHESNRSLLCQTYFIYNVCYECLSVFTLNKK